MWLSRVRENLTHGSLGGRWKRGGPTGHCGSWAGVLRSHHNGLVGTQPIDQLLPRQRPTRPGYPRELIFGAPEDFFQTIA